MVDRTKKLVYTALMAALVFVATYIIRVPLIVSNGYVHIGDGIIFISVILLGGKNGAWAGAIGACLSDFLAGYSNWALPTFMIKGIMALLMGFVIEKFPNMKFKWIIGAVIGSVWQIFAYYVVSSVMVGSFISTIIEIPGNVIQSLVGILVSIVFMGVFKNTPYGKGRISNI